MTSSFKQAYRVDNVPWFWWPLYWLYGYGCGGLIFLYLRLCHHTCRIRYHNGTTLNDRAPAIYGLWHDAWPACIAVFPRYRRHIWLNHPYWYMKPVHVAAACAGIERLILGSTGHDGRAAAEELVAVLRQGNYSTLMMPDGPNGPPHLLKKGILHISQHSGVPMVPLRIVTTHGWTMASWDHRVFPIPFWSTMTVSIGDPIVVTATNFANAARALVEGLDGGAC